MTEKEYKEKKHFLIRFMDYLMEKKLPLYNFTQGTIANKFLEQDNTNEKKVD